jgi:hypothetical protein
MYMLKLVMSAANTMRIKEGINPALENAMGKLSTPPPQTVATRLKMAMLGEDRRDSQSWAGTSNSREG